MTFPRNPHELSRIAARFMLVFLMAPFVLTLLQFFLYAIGLGLFPAPGASASVWAGTFWMGWVYTAMISPVFAAFAYTLLAWLIASMGVLAASRGPILAAALFALAALAATPGLRGEYWFVTVPSVLVLIWLAIAAFRLRNYIHQVQVTPGEAEAIHLQHRALQQRDISTQQIISRR